MNLIHLLRENCRRLGDKAIFLEGGRATSYGEFDRKVRAVAHSLTGAGVRPGDRVLVLMPLSVDLYAALCGVWAAGACVVIFDPSAGRDHISACLETAGVACFVGNRQSLLLRAVSGAIRAIPLHRDVGRLIRPTGESDTFPVVDVADDAPALITFTSGSTGLPKAIVRSHGFLLEQHGAITEALPYREDDVDLAVLSVFTLVNMMEGITTVLPRDSLRDIAKVNAGRLVEQMRRHGVTRVTASPKLLEKLASWALDHGVDLPELRCVNIGGGPVFPDVLALVARVADPDGIRVVYGSTEAEPIAELRYRDISWADRHRMQQGYGLLVGEPSRRLRLKILRGTGAGPVAPGRLAEEAEPGQWGEIVVCGPHVVKGYLNPEQNALTKLYAGADTWHRTGDCGYLDEAGRLWLLGRTSQVLYAAEEPVFPFAVESAIRAKHHVPSAVVQWRGELVLAVERGRRERAVRDEYGGRFRVLAVDSIPMDRRHASKVDYGALGVLLERRLGK